MRNLLIIAFMSLIMASCSEYQRMQKSSDPNEKFEYAKRAYEQGKYVQAYTILKDVVTQFKGSGKAEESLYLLGMSHYENKEYPDAAAYFQSYYNRYPKGKFTELARYYAGYSFYLDSPEPQLDQSGTIKAIEELQGFLDYFPRSERVASAQNAIFEMQDKLTLKELQNAQLYYNLGNYMGNNYESAVIVAKNAIKEYPYSKYKEQLEMLVLKARFQEASQSINEKKASRFRDVIDEYYSFINNYPDGPNRDEADNIYKIAKKYVDLHE
ncbi:MAG: outer membrane protein assembly factor BamD [Muribaculaceae bacterium]|nr:outer membrane protein assembly factor BamD [Muribaculaceae bacterium]MDE5968101.1 outer membrane protein assembly factor BamD [Muribaculaceae bacterium]MDE7393169.1 outer membrane protein assembly factor BamD [Muribaculaceae bacterium]